MFSQLYNSHHNAAIDLAVLLDRLGPDAPAMADDLVPKLYCEKCREKKRGERGKLIGVIYSPAAGPKGWPGG